MDLLTLESLDSRFSGKRVYKKKSVCEFCLSFFYVFLSRHLEQFVQMLRSIYAKINKHEYIFTTLFPIPNSYTWKLRKNNMKKSNLKDCARSHGFLMFVSIFVENKNERRIRQKWLCLILSWKPSQILFIRRRFINACLGGKHHVLVSFPLDL